jgi:type I restriction enzyme, S subunit
MKIETFFEKFDQLDDAPNAVAKLRELIVQLAIRGALVPNNPEEEPVRLNMSGDLSSDSLPSNWRSGILGDAITLEYGENLPAAKRSESGEYPVYGSNGIVGTHDSFLIKEPAIIVGRKGSAGALNIANGPSWTTDVAYFVRPPSDLDLRFTYCLLLSLRLDELGKGIKPGLSRNEAYDVPIALPPFAEQKRIVTKVDELMALCDRLLEQLQERDTRYATLTRAALARFADAPTSANLNLLFHDSYTIPPTDLRETILTLAIQGRIVPQDLNDEPASTSFPKLASVALPSGSDAFPEHWLRVPLGSTGKWRGGGTPSTSRMDFWQGRIPWVSPKDMKILLLSDAQDHISEAAVEGSSVRMIPAGSLLMVVRGMILARAFPVALTTREVTINQDMKALLPQYGETKEFLLLALRAFEPEVLAAIERSTHGTCKLQTEFLERFVIPIPPLAEQRRIVARVDQLMPWSTSWKHSSLNPAPPPKNSWKPWSLN